MRKGSRPKTQYGNTGMDEWKAIREKSGDPLGDSFQVAYHDVHRGICRSEVYRVTEPEEKRHGHNVQYPPVSCKPLELIHG